ncbi:hypothetical protein B0H13DRAFT_1855263 [Mycena leptocephala]|nr:hypothetical protein B0H13DRAFT_1855263 [Mycena leptocephala]
MPVCGNPCHTQLLAKELSKRNKKSEKIALVAACGKVAGKSVTDSKGIATMVEIMMNDAIAKSSERDQRDRRAMVWTVRSLTDDTELEPFVEALPDLVWSPNGRRTIYDDMIHMLLETRDLQLVTRIEDLLRGCDGGFLSPELQTRRRISCVKALWAIAYFSLSNVSTTPVIFNHTILASYLRSDNLVPDVKHHLASAYALVRWSGYIYLSSLIGGAYQALKALPTKPPAQNPRAVLQMVQCQAEKLGYVQFSGALSHLLSLDLPTIIDRLPDALKSFSDTTHDILLEYLSISADLEKMPYEFEATYSTIRQIVGRPDETKLKGTFIVIVDTHMMVIRTLPTVHPIDIAVDTIMGLLQGNSEGLDPVFLRSFVEYIANRRPEKETSRRMFSTCDPQFIGSLLTKCIVDSRGSHIVNPLSAIWSSCYWSGEFACFDEETLVAVSTSQQFFFSSCTAALLEAHILNRAAGLSVFPSSSAASEPVGGSEQWTTGWFAILVEFLECRDAFRMLEWHADVEVKTFNFLIRSRPVDGVSQPLQRRFADSFLKLVTGEFIESHARLIQSMTAWITWNGGSPAKDIFNDPDGRGTLCKALTKCVEAASHGKLPLDAERMTHLNGLIAELSSHILGPTISTPPALPATMDDETTTVPMGLPASK